MFDAKYNDFVEALLSQFANWNRGSIIPWHQIELCMGRSRNDEGGWCIINRFRRRLLAEREIVTLAKDAVGVRLLTHEEAAKEIPALRQKKAYRQVNRALKETATVDAGSLSDRLRLALTMQRGNLQRQRLEIGRSRRALEHLGKKSPTHPVRRLAAV